VHLVERAHFQSCGKEDDHTTAENPMLHANFATFYC